MNGFNDRICAMQRIPLQIVFVTVSFLLFGEELACAQYGSAPALQNPPISASSQVLLPSGFGTGLEGNNAINSGMSFSGPFGQRTLGNGAGLMGGSNGFASVTGSNSRFSVGQGVGFNNLSSAALVDNNLSQSGSIVGALQQDTGHYGLYGIIGPNNEMNQYGMMQNSFGDGTNQFQSGAQGNLVVILQGPTHSSVGFNHPAQSTVVLNQKLSAELSKSQGITALSPIVVQIDGTTAVIHGTVATEHDRDLAAQLALLEPGIDNVRNDLHLQAERRPPSEKLSAPSNPPLPDLPAP
jgi:hypothetical protein